MTLAIPAHQQMREALDQGNAHPESPISLGGAEWDNHRNTIHITRSPHLPTGTAKVEWEGQPYGGVYVQDYVDYMPEHQVLDFIECEVMYQPMSLDRITVTLPA